MSDQVRGNEIAMIFQDPMKSRIQTMKIGMQIWLSRLIKHRQMKEDALARALN